MLSNTYKFSLGRGIASLRLIRQRRCLTSSPSPPPPPNPSASNQTAFQRFWAWTTTPRASWKESPTEAAVICTVFAITGSSSLYFVRPLLNKLGIEGSMREGPNSYRVLSLVLISPVYATILITLGTLSGRHVFFARMGHKILSRFIPSAKVRETIKCDAAATKTKI